VKKRAILLMILGFWISGCTTQGARSGFLSNYEVLSQGKYLPGYWADQKAITQSQYPQILVAGIDTTKIIDQKGITVRDAQESLRQDLEVAANDLGVKKCFIFDKSGTSQALLELGITEMNPGSVAGRFWAGELGAGHAYVQVEGRLVDTVTHKTLATFSVRKRDSGAVGIQDVGGDVGPELVKEMLREISRNIISELKGTFGF
jgi:hypothetical protein